MEGALLAFSSGEGGPLAVEGVAHSLGRSTISLPLEGGGPLAVEGVAHSVPAFSNYNRTNSRISLTVILSKILLERDISAILRRI